MTVYMQDPDSKLNWAHDWSPWLGQDDSILTRQWTVEPEGPTLTNDTSETVTVTGMTVGNVYRLQELVTTVQGLKGERSITILCGQR